MLLCQWSAADSSATILLPILIIMKYIVELYVGGTTFKEEVYATDTRQARQVALARNPNAKIVGVNVSFK